MAIKFPNWAKNLALVGLIFSAGTYINRLETRIEKIEKIETFVSLHHQNDWLKDEKVKIISTTEVEDHINASVATMEELINNSAEEIKILGESNKTSTNKIGALYNWAKQEENVLKEVIPPKYKINVVYNTFKYNNVEDYKKVFLNRQHVLGKNFKRGDKITLRNQKDGGNEVVVVVEDYTYDYENKDKLLQVNLGLLQYLGLNSDTGVYELVGQKKQELKTIDDFMKDVK